MNAGIDLNRPRAAACPDYERQDLPTVTAHDIYLGCGFEAVSGFPLPNGFFPLALPPVGVVMTTPAEWERYMALCDGERSMQGVNP